MVERASAGEGEPRAELRGERSERVTGDLDRRRAHDRGEHRLRRTYAGEVRALDRCMRGRLRLLRGDERGERLRPVRETAGLAHGDVGNRRFGVDATSPKTFDEMGDVGRAGGLGPPGEARVQHGFVLLGAPGEEVAAALVRRRGSRDDVEQAQQPSVCTSRFATPAGRAPA